MFSIYDSGPFTGVYIYDMDSKTLNQLEGLKDVTCIWAPYDNLLVCSEGTYIEQTCKIYSVDEQKVISQFSYVSESVYWLNDHEVIYTVYNYDTTLDYDGDYPYPSDLIIRDVNSNTVKTLLSGTEEYDYGLRIENGALVVRKYRVDRSAEPELVHLNELDALNYIEMDDVRHSKVSYDDEIMMKYNEVGQIVVWNWQSNEKIFPEIDDEFIHFQLLLEGNRIVHIPYDRGDRDTIHSYDFLQGRDEVYEIDLENVVIDCGVEDGVYYFYEYGMGY